MTTVMVNEHHRQQGDREVSQFEALAAFYQLHPKVDVLFKFQSGRYKKVDWYQAECYEVAANHA